MNDVTGRVERGAALLDAKRPGWWQGIDLDRLDVQSPCDCIAGQQPGGFTATMNLLDIGHSAEAAWYGFDAYVADPDLPVAEFSRLRDEECNALTEAWRDLILHRQQADAGLMAEPAAALREVPGEETARNTGREAWHARQRGGS